MTKLDTCKLCHPSRGLILSDPLWNMVLNENQALLGRCYFALNRHETDITKLRVAEQTELFRLFAQAKEVLDKLFAPDHYNYVWLMNVEPHVHAHIIPRYRSEREFAGEQFTDGRFGDHYNPGAEKILSDDTFDKLAAAISMSLCEAGEDS